MSAPHGFIFIRPDALADDALIPEVWAEDFGGSGCLGEERLNGESKVLGLVFSGALGGEGFVSFEAASLDHPHISSRPLAEVFAGCAAVEGDVAAAKSPNPLEALRPLSGRAFTVLDETIGGDASEELDVVPVVKKFPMLRVGFDGGRTALPDTGRCKVGLERLAKGIDLDDDGGDCAVVEEKDRLPKASSRPELGLCDLFDIVVASGCDVEPDLE